MTPDEFYSHFRKKFHERFNKTWKHLDPWGDDSSEIQETLMRSGVEARILKPATSEDYASMANGLMIRDFLLSRRNYHS